MEILITHFLLSLALGITFLLQLFIFLMLLLLSVLSIFFPFEFYCRDFESSLLSTFFHCKQVVHVVNNWCSMDFPVFLII